VRTVVIGSGPAGLEAAAAAEGEIIVLEAGLLGAGVRTWLDLRAWAGWDAFTGPAGRALTGTTPAGPDRPFGRQILREWLEPLAARLDVRTRQRVLGIARGPRGSAPRSGPFRLAIETLEGDRTFLEADRVIDAGGAGTWRPAGEDGLPLPSENRAASAARLRYGPVSPDDLPAGPVLVVGSHPAARCQLEALAGRELHHAGEEAVRAGFDVIPHRAIERFGRSSEGVTVHADGGRFHAAQVVVLTGTKPALDYTRELAVTWDREQERPDWTGEPGLRMVGARSSGR
jgi:hypothetical protein